ncbi:hypothetical protein [Mycolicibacterium sp. lyk4-40-TYG-92]|uniref:hypothetical protein n=1 Tax=Mycolicibacterium sp. lyk4-40-TYG-92 TaxID=3040295 RepID=UPI00254EB742|nr:hypothetical protein [Mycolicibacterium sp. lyk4-40-TYG-92]
MLNRRQGDSYADRPGRNAPQSWSQYLEWNQAVADVVYPVSEDFAPAYMDLETDVLARIAQCTGRTGGDARQGLAEAVKSIALSRPTGRVQLTALVNETRAWSRKKVRRNPPPCLAFLALTVLAAEDMGKDGDLAPHAYYPRLARLLGLPDSDSSLRQQYQHHAEYLWQALNGWLGNQDGERGMPTAYALSRRYVGLPMSQALVREGDRQKFPLMFAQYGLGPGMHVAPEDLVRYLDDWFTTQFSSAPANLRNLWKRPAVRERIASIAAVELENWDGAIAGADAANTAALQSRATVVVNIRSGFRGSTMDISLGVRPLGEMRGQMEIRTTDETWLPITLTPGTAGLWRTSYTEAIDRRSMLEGLIRIRHPHGEGGSEYKHMPRQVIPLLYDELQSAYVEMERLQLGADAMLLVRAIAPTKVKTSAVERVHKALTEAARPGFEMVENAVGLPEGWVLFKNVQLFSAPADQSLNELVPLAQNKLTIAGGLRIPARIRKWSTLCPPEVRATVQSETLLRVTLSYTDSDELIGQWISRDSVLVAPLNDLNLDDGDYTVSLFIGDKPNVDPVQQATIRLRSSRNVDALWHNAPRLVYSLDKPRGAISATEHSEMRDYSFVDGLSAMGDAAQVEPTIHANGNVTWGEESRQARPVTIQIGSPDPNSCIVTGAHRIVLPPALGGKAPKFINGTCSSCGLVKRYPGWLPRFGKGLSNVKAAAVTVDMRELPKVTDAGPNWDAALDVLMHLGGGSITSLQSVAMQLEGSALFVDNFIRGLQALGHIAIERDHLWRPTRWEISPSCLAEGADGTWRFTGFWPPPLVQQAAVQSARYGGRFTQRRADGAPSTYSIADLSLEDIEKVTDLDGDGEIDEFEASINVVYDAGAQLLGILPRLSEVAASLKRASMPGFDSAERFDVRSANWVVTGDAHAPGAYRLRRGFETLYAFRMDSDVDSGTAALAPVQVVKHLAANIFGQSLLTYLASSETALVPLGCDLPGLYARAIVAMSGQLPERKGLRLNGKLRSCLAYRLVDRDAADLLATLLAT